MAQFDFYLNRQGVRGPQGIQGEQGFSPIITVATNTLSEYVLQIQTQNNTFLTANLREHKDDLGGTYIRYNRETGVMFAGDADVASESQMGVVRFATAIDIEREDDSSVVSPADVADMIAAVDPSSDISDLQNRVTTLEGKTESLEDSVSDNSLAISELQSNVSGLLANYVPKTRTINGYALSSNITLTANDVNAYSKSETDALLADKADVSDLPDMNNYYNTTQVDLMLNEKADISDIPTVGNGTITINQGGVQKGQFSLNQSGDATINLTDGGGGGGGSYIEGNGIDITNDIISVVPDGTTIDFNTNGELKVISAPTPNNMVTTDTTQTIGGTKIFNNASVSNILSLTRDSGAVLQLGTTAVLDNQTRYKNITAPMINSTAGTTGGGSVLSVKTSGDGISNFSTELSVGDSTYASLILKSFSNVSIIREGNTYTNLDSGNISSYALTSLPTATTSALGGVIPDGTTITVDANGTIHGASTYVLPTASTSTLGGVKVDGTTVTIDANGVISASGGSTPSNMVTTDTAQTITAAKTFGGNTALYGTRFFLPNDKTEMYVGSSGKTLYLQGSVKGNYQNSAFGDVVFSNNIADYLPTASTTTKGGVKVDGTTITIDGNGVISSSGGGSSYTEGTGIDITSNVISIDDTVVATKDDLDEKQDILSPNPPLTITEYTKSSLEGMSYTSDNSGVYSSLNNTYVNTTVSASITNTLNFQSSDQSVINAGFWNNGFIDIPYTLGQTICSGNKNVDTSYKDRNVIFGKFVNSEFIPILCIDNADRLRLINTDSHDNYYITTATGTGWYRYIRPVSDYTSFNNSGSATEIRKDGVVVGDLSRPYGSVTKVSIENSNLVVYDAVGKYLFYYNSALTATQINRLSEITVARVLPITGKGNTSSTPINITNLGLYNVSGAITVSMLTTENALGENLFDISGVTKQTYLDLSIGTGLSVVNGALTATATPVTVDQTYNASSTNAQSGTAVAGAIANKVTGTGITNMVKLTQAQYDALATKDTNTFYVIVAASS